MRPLAIFAALTLVAAPIVTAPSVAYADGIERPRAPRPRPRPRPPAPVPAPAPAPVIEQGPEVVTLSDSFFTGGGGVGVDIGTGYVGGGTTVIIGGSRASTFAYASASARAYGGARGRGGHGGGGHSCGCR